MDYSGQTYIMVDRYALYWTEIDYSGKVKMIVDTFGL
jgi:hypothetical protein